MEKQDVIDFFNRCAPTWDEEMIKDDAIIGIIMDNAGVCPGVDVLDVACGTGVLIPYYKSRKAASVTCIDISPAMAKIAAAKYPDTKIICDDVETHKFEKQYDVVMVYNALPHFQDPAELVKALAGLTSPGGRLSIAHGMSREKIIAHHSGCAKNVSNILITAEELKELMRPYFEITAAISDDQMYQVCGIKRI